MGPTATVRRPARWLLRQPAQESAARLFCLPYSGCGASVYRRWPQFVGDVEICPVQPPGRENRTREPAHATYEALAAAMIEALAPHLDRPFAFFGHCGSALPGYEASVRLGERRGPLPARLFVSSEVAPQHGPYGRFLFMSDSELADEVTALFRVRGVDPLPDLVALHVEILRADLEANKRYRRARPARVPCPITAIGWTADREVDARLMLGWADCGDTTFRTLPGEHYRFLEAPPELLAVIAEDMAVGAAGPCRDGGRRDHAAPAPGRPTPASEPGAGAPEVGARSRA